MQMQQSVIQIGNSLGIVIPKGLRGELQAGDKVLITGKPTNILITPAKTNKTGGVDAKFMQMVDEFITEHEDVLKELAKR
ncbi:MAG: AbrB/MazE/SpoVT family DNA-binding domain-containing protein [Patescibacteria group bacterium]